MKRVTLWVIVALVARGSVNPCSAGSKVTLLSDEKNPKIAFATQELQGALADRGHTVSHESLAQVGKGGTGIFIVLATQADTAVIDAVTLSGTLKSEGFSIRKTSGRNKVMYWVVGQDAAGAMYGGLELAEVIRCEDLEGVQAMDKNPYMALRGIKFNCPLDERTPTYSNHNGDSQRKNVLVMWDMAFWKAYIDDLARFRYNYVSLWNLHPFPSMVRVPGYEKVALDDVQSTTETLKMTMDEKIAFWREVMRYGKDRNVDFYVVTWNIFVLGTDGQYGLTDKYDNPTTTDYFRKSVKQMLLTYPDLAGIGLTAGEHMPKMTQEQKEDWAFATYGRGVLDAAALQPGRKITFVHRQQQKDNSRPCQTYSNTSLANAL